MNEGWGGIENAQAAHYFKEGRSLCGKWMAFDPRWESNQTRGPEPKPRSGTCLPCWRKAPERSPEARSRLREGEEA